MQIFVLQRYLHCIDLALDIYCYLQANKKHRGSVCYWLLEKLNCRFYKKIVEISELKCRIWFWYRYNLYLFKVQWQNMKSQEKVEQRRRKKFPFTATSTFLAAFRAKFNKWAALAAIPKWAIFLEIWQVDQNTHF